MNMSEEQTQGNLDPIEKELMEGAPLWESRHASAEEAILYSLQMLREFEYIEAQGEAVDPDKIPPDLPQVATWQTELERLVIWGVLGEHGASVLSREEIETYLLDLWGIQEDDLEEEWQKHSDTFARRKALAVAELQNIKESAEIYPKTLLHTITSWDKTRLEAYMTMVVEKYPDIRYLDQKLNWVENRWEEFHSDITKKAVALDSSSTDYITALDDIHLEFATQLETYLMLTPAEIIHFSMMEREHGFVYLDDLVDFFKHLHDSIQAQKNVNAQYKRKGGAEYDGETASQLDAREILIRGLSYGARTPIETRGLDVRISDIYKRFFARKKLPSMQDGDS